MCDRTVDRSGLQTWRRTIKPGSGPGLVALLLVTGVTWSLAGSASGAVPVEDRSSTGMTPRPRLEPSRPAEPPADQPTDWSSPPPDQSVSGSSEGTAPSGLAQLFTELQTLRNEVQELRSLAEEQQHKLRRLEEAQLEQYQNLDGRIVQLTGGAAATAGAGAAADRPINADTTPVPPAGGGRTSTGSGAPGTGGEKAAYQAAFESMKARKFDQSIEQFRKLIQDYPNGEMTPGSWYWLGELYLAKAQLSESRESFAEVVNLYPTHNKAPDALYKMGVVYHRMGDITKALEYLDRVQREFPASAAAGLAKTYAGELR